ncbi:glycosyltransferase [Brevibacterium litoralis]|uniref:glycosyltransferase n=1 Tax=Brevibacterium litoralis TaxID=3138935 RepID=UPI0032F002A5
MTPDSNLLSNPSFTSGLTAWHVDGEDDVTAVGVDFEPKWSVEGASTAYLFAQHAGASPTLSQDVTLEPRSEGAPGRYQVGAFFGAHRSDIDIEVHATFADGEIRRVGRHTVTSRADRMGGTRLDDYEFAAFFVEIPPLAETVRLSISLGSHTGEGIPGRFGFVTHTSLQVADEAGVRPWLPQDVPQTHFSSAMRLGGDDGFVATRFPLTTWNGTSYGPALHLEDWLAERYDGCNLLSADFADPWADWDITAARTDSVGVDFNASWAIPGIPTMYWYADTTSDEPRFRHAPAVSVIGGAHYELGAYLGYHRCEGSIGVDWLGADGAIVASDELMVESSTRMGGTSLTRFDHQLALVRAPYEATSARVFLHRSGTQVGDTSFIFMALPFFGLTRAAAPTGVWNQYGPHHFESDLVRFDGCAWVQAPEGHEVGAASRLDDWAPTRAQRQAMLLDALANEEIDGVLEQLRDSAVTVPKGALDELVDQLIEHEEFESAVHTAYYAFAFHPCEATGSRLDLALRKSRYGAIADLYADLTSDGAAPDEADREHAFGFTGSETPRTGVVGLSGGDLVVWAVDRVQTLADFSARVDGKPCGAPPKRDKGSPVQTISYARLSLSDALFDGDEHVIELVDASRDDVVWTMRTSVVLDALIEDVSNGRVRGWLASSVEMEEPPVFAISVDGKRTGRTSASYRRTEVEEARPDEVASAWAIDLPVRLHRDSQLVEVGFADSGAKIDGAQRWMLNRQSAVNAIREIRRHVESLGLDEPAKAWLTQDALPAMLDAARGQEDAALPSLEARNLVEPAPTSEREKDPVVDVVVPVYRDLEATRACLESVLSAEVNTPFHLIAINDASPEPEVTRWLEEFCEARDIELHVHRRNRGFPATVNEGMTLHSGRDVVLLNSDAIVSDGWLDEMRGGAYSSDRVASVTAMSNNATIFSYPITAVEQEMPADISREELATLALEKSRGEYVVTPACHGFCVYLRRDALDEIGIFDDKAFTKGYGEETDWSQRANDHGWHHVAAPSVFVEHLGSRSFQGDRSALLQNSFSVIRDRYPEYDAWIQDVIHDDPLAAHRRRLDLARIARFGRGFTLHLTHHLGGGTEKHVRDLTETYAAADARSLVLRPDPRRTSTHVQLSCAGLELEANYAVATEYDELVADLKSAGVERGHLHHLIGFEAGFPQRLLGDLDVPYVATIHDYASACPRVFLTRPNGQFCDGPRSLDECTSCISKHGPLPVARDLYVSSGKSVAGWREGWQSILSGAEELLFPTQSHLERLGAHLGHPNMRVIPHPEDDFPDPVMPEPGKDRYTVALLGGLSWEKGHGVLRDLAGLASRRSSPLDFVVIGPTADDSAFDDLDNVRIHGFYKPAEAPRLLEKYQPDVALFLSVWPETWCYTLSEALSSKCTVVAPKLGAFEERLTSRPGATLFDQTRGAEDVLAALHRHLGVSARV